jgi:hypothetical protein
MKKNIFVALLFLLTVSITYSQGTVRGFIFDKSTGEPIPFTNVLLLGTEKGATTGLEGSFTIPKVKPGKYTIRITNVEFANFEKEIVVKNDEITKVQVEMKKGNNLDEVEVTAEDRNKEIDPMVSVNKIDKEGIERIPSIGGESDVLNALGVTPGVVTTGDQGGQLYVRGGTPIQNKVLLDGMTIYNPFHSIGFFSVFDTELIKNVDIHTGGFGAKFSGRISSVMDITYRDGNSKKVSGKISISPFMARTYIEAPLYKAKTVGGSAGSIIISAKKSLIEYTSKGLYPYANDGDGMPFSFLDIYGKMSFKSSGGSKVSLFGFNFNDKVNYTGLDLGWNSFGGGLNFTVVPSSNPVLIKGKINFSNYKINMQETDMKPRFSEVFGFEGGFDFTYFLPKSSEINYGISIGGFKTNFETYNEINRKIQLENFSTEIGVYVSYRAVFGKIFVFEPSFRMQYYASVPKGFSAEPRLAMKINAHKKFRIKFAGGRFSQNFTSSTSDQDVVNLFSGFLSAPTSFPTNFTTESGKEKEISNGLQKAWHLVGGFEIDVIKGLSLNIEAYYKWFDQLTNINSNKIYDDTPENSSISDHLKTDFIIEESKAWGVDVGIKYQAIEKRLNINAAYSLGKVTRWDGFKSYAPVYDRRHNFNIIASYTAGKKKDWDFSVRWNFGSGLPFTQTSGFYQAPQFANGVNTDYVTENSTNVSTQLAEINQGRLPMYQRLDITVKKKFEFKHNMLFEVILGVTNVTNQKNVFYINRVTNKTIYQLPILPSLGLSFKF